MIKFACSGCGKSLVVKDEAAGKKVACKSCQAKTVVPATDLNVPKTEVVRAPVEVRPVSVVREPPDETECPFCKELIKAGAIKCRHCGEMFDGSGDRSPAKVNRTVATLLSILLPGLGHVYRGMPVRGIIWFVGAAIGYPILVVPGAAIHICSVIAVTRDSGKLINRKAV